jgi:hypothetical protein
MFSQRKAPPPGAPSARRPRMLRGGAYLNGTPGLPVVPAGFA